MTTAGDDTGNSREDELLVRVYRHVTVRQAGRSAGTYNLGAGLARFCDWLDEHEAVDPGQAVPAASGPDTAGWTPVAENLVAENLVAGRIGTAVKLDKLADEAVTELYSRHYGSLVRLAVLLVQDEPTAEEVVQECFIAMHDGWHRLGDEEKALAFLKQAVVNRSRSVLRHRGVIDRNPPKPAPDTPGAGQEAVSLDNSAVITALRALPDRQRQALVLRYYANLSEAQIAEMMGISKGAVKSHTARGMSALRALLEEAP
jgi:RNA polymerase sigma-70 factor (sigma-E family)